MMSRAEDVTPTSASVGKVDDCGAGERVQENS